MTTPDFNELDDLLSSYVNSNKLAGVVAAVVSPNEKLFSTVIGCRELEGKAPMEWDSIFRIYSMTKPITSIAAMILWEEGAFDLDDPMADYLPTFRETKVMEADGTIRPALRPMTIRHILCHTAGITLPAFADNHLVPLYLERGIDGSRSKGCLADVVHQLGELPVFFDPGSQWSYSMATDIVGRLVEVWSGMKFETFLQERIFKPLGMFETGFSCSSKNISRLTSNYSAENGSLGPLLDGGKESRFLHPPEFVSGSGGLLSTASDYIGFLQMLLNGGQLNDTQILKPETLSLMTQNHLIGDMEDMGAGDFGETSWKGIGFGLGFNIVLDPLKASFSGPAGEYGWTGAAGTAFFVNPELNIAALLLTQYMPSHAYPLRAEFREAVYRGFL